LSETQAAPAPSEPLVDPDRAPLPRRPAGPPDRPRQPSQVRDALPGIGWRAAWPAVALYAGLRLASVLFLLFFAAGQHRSLLSLLGGYDAIHYAGIVAHGYDQAIPVKPNGELGITNLAFFPLFPGLTAALDPILPGGPGAAGIAVAWLTGLAAAWGLFAVSAWLRDRRTGVLLAALWAVLPHALVQSMGYTETLFTALTAWSLYALMRRSWLVAGLLCALAGLTRPTAAALVLAVGLAALVAVVRRRDGWRPWVAGALAPTGLLGYIAWVGLRLGRADGYVHVQRDAWKMSYDDGHYTLHTLYALLTKPQPMTYYVTALVLLLALALLVLLCDGRTPWPLLVYSLAIVAMTFFGDGYFHAKARLLMPAFPLLLPIAYALTVSRRSTRIVVLAIMTVVSAGYAVYLCLVWRYSP
jgi:hypothetical protein